MSPWSTPPEAMRSPSSANASSRRSGRPSPSAALAATTAATALAALEPSPLPGAIPFSIASSMPRSFDLRSLEQGGGGDSRAVGVGVERDGGAGAADARDGDARLRGDRRRHAIADGGDREAEHVEPAGDVGHRRRRERGRGAGGALDAHRPLPATPTVEASRFAVTALASAARGSAPALRLTRAATVSRSPKTPAAVTAGPAPGPRTTSGRSR